VSIVPVLPEGMQALVSAISAGGYLLAEEYRFPIDPRHLLLFTWANEPDAPEFLQGGHDLAANLNRAVIAGADREWFHNPERRPTTLPLSALPTSDCFPVGPSIENVTLIVEWPMNEDSTFALFPAATMNEAEVCRAWCRRS
jgi:hypothetical protein